VSEVKQPTIVLVAHAAHQHGGMERVFAELIRRAHGEFRLVLVSRDLAPELRPFVEWKRVRVPRRPVPLLFGLFYVLAGLRVARTKAGVVHTLGALVPNRADIASVHFCHAGFHVRQEGGDENHVPISRRINTRIARALALRAERWSYRPQWTRVLAAVSQGVAAELEDHYPGARVVVTPNGVDLERFRPDPEARRDVRGREGVAADDVVALFVGSEWDRKGLLVAIEALGQIRAAGGRPPLLWVVGGGDRERFQSQAVRCGVGDRVRFFGIRADTERFYQAADLFVLPSRYEAFPLVSLEAAACGLPIVAAPLNGVAEIVGDGEAGLIVERTPKAFARALDELAGDAARRQRLGEAARRSAATFTWERSAESVLAIYRAALGEPASTLDIAA
jgi:glycosyltransferase involved in cell wall biosynthesis